nr:heparinase II/III family protein [Alcaligenes faecalis]
MKKNLDPYQVFKLIIGGDYLRILKEGYKVRKDLAPIPVALPLKWRFKDSNVEFNFHAWRFLSAAWAYYLKFPNVDVARKVISFSSSVGSDWLAFIGEKKSKYAWYDMSTGIRAMHIAFMKYLCNEYEGEFRSEEALVDSLADSHIEWLSKQNNITRGNHAIYQILGLRILGIFYDCSAEEYAEANMARLLIDAFDENYVSTENSPFYHKYNLEIFRRVQPELFPNLRGDLERLLVRGPQVTKWLTGPAGDLYRIGDTEGSGVLLEAEDINEINIGSDSEVFQDYAASGYQIIRSHPRVNVSESFSLVLRGGPTSYVHAHCDALAVIFYNCGEEIFSDAGKFTYEYGKERDWFISDAAHCTAGLSDRDFNPKEIGLRGTKLEPIKKGSYFYHLGGCVKKGDVFTHYRAISFAPGESLTISDLCQSIEGTDIEIRYILGPGVSFTGGKEGVLTTARGRSYKVYFEGAIDFIESAPAHKPEAWVSSSYHFKEPVSLVRIRCSGDSAMVSMRMDLR